MPPPNETMSQPPSQLALADKTFSWRDGRKWFDAGLNYFKQVKNYWYLACMAVGTLLILIGQLAPPLMALVIIFASPIITAFMVSCCHQVKQNQPLSFNQLWQPVTNNMAAILFLGMVSALLSLLLNAIHEQVLNFLGLPIELTEAMVRDMSGKESLLRALLSLLTSLPLALALAFSPALIALNRYPTLTAITLSIQGVIKAWRSFLMLTLLFILVFFGVVVIASVAIAVVQGVLGSGGQLLTQLIVMFFVLTAAGIGLCAQYQAYTEIFIAASDQEGDDGTEIYTEI